jgi:hypothetical protein
VQALNISADVQKQYDPMRTAVSMGTGAIIGGGMLIDDSHQRC